MRKKNSYKLLKIKKNLVKQNVFRDYLKTFKNIQMHFLLSKIAFLFEVKIDLATLAKIEASLINQKSEEMFLKPIQEIFKQDIENPLHNFDFKNLAIFLFYIFQTSTYYYDLKNNKKNIFIDEDDPVFFIQKNTEKRKYFANFGEQLSKIYPNYNLYLRQILKWVL